MKKVLFCATGEKHLADFHIPYMQWFNQHGFEVHTASNRANIALPVEKQFDIPIQRSPFRMDNIKAYNQLKQIINEEKYDIILCHTPIGGAIARLAAKNARKNGTRVLYTAHGFHFYKGAPIINWVIYYPVEKWLARFTDCIITINSEDYNRVKNKFRSAIEFVPGMGVNLEVFRTVTTEERAFIRKKYGYMQGDFLLIYAAELNENKNQHLLIKQIATLVGTIPNIKLLLVGAGDMYEKLIQLVDKLGLHNKVELLGHRFDVADLLPMCDVGVASSIREGLPINLIEDMACGLPIVASNNRGHRELITHKVNGFIFDLNRPEHFTKYIEELYQDNELVYRMSADNLDQVHKYSIERGIENMSRIYMKYFCGNLPPDSPANTGKQEVQ